MTRAAGSLRYNTSMDKPDPRRIVEDAQAYLPRRPSTIWEDHGDVVLRHVPMSPLHWYGSATRPRFASADADRRIRDVQHWFGEHGRIEFSWMFGEHATPADLPRALERAGAVPDPEDPGGLAMLLEREPPPAPAGIDVRRVETFEDFRDQMRITLSDAGPEAWAKTEANLPAAWEEARSDDRMYSFLARLDGEPISTAQLVWLSNGLPYLGGATTLRAARGHGAFRALVRARWDEVVRRGMPILLVQAGKNSAPILTQLGFETVGPIYVYLDRSDRQAG